MKPPRFKLSTLCLIVALVALVLGYGWQAIENNRLRVELETTHAEAVMVRDQMANALAEKSRRGVSGTRRGGTRYSQEVCGPGQGRALNRPHGKGDWSYHPLNLQAGQQRRLARLMTSRPAVRTKASWVRRGAPHGKPDRKENTPSA